MIGIGGALYLQRRLQLFKFMSRRRGQKKVIIANQQANGKEQRGEHDQKNLVSQTHGGLLLCFDKLVANAPDGLDIFAGRVYFCAKVFDIDGNGSDIAVMLSPNGVKDLLARQYAPAFSIKYCKS